MKVIKKEPEVLWMFETEDDLFTYDTRLRMTFNEFNRLSGMNDDLFTYEVGIPGLSCPSHGEQQCDDLGNYHDLDVYEPRVCYDENEGIYAKTVIFVNKRLVRLMDVTIEQWLDLMYGDHKIVDQKIKEEVISKWLIEVTRNRDDEEVLTDEEIFDLKETYVNEEDEIAKIFRIETNIFDFDVPWVPEEPWSKNRVPYEIIDHFCIPFLDDGELKDEALIKKGEFEEFRDPCSFDDNEPYHANEEEEQYKEGRCELLGNPNQEPLTCKIERFEVIKYSFGPVKEFVAIKECGYNDWIKTEEDACHAYQDIFAKMDEGCLSSQIVDTAYPTSTDTAY
ncbi:hypothetical protein Tco_1541325 [Tanacetum coccineum]